MDKCLTRPVFTTFQTNADFPIHMSRLQSIATGIILGIGTVLLHTLLDDSQGQDLTSILLVLIGSIYCGFALLQTSIKATIIELVVASIFIVLGFLGLWFSTWIIVVGLFLHGFWDLAHHNAKLGLAQIPLWYIPFCATYDWFLAIYLTYQIVG